MEWKLSQLNEKITFGIMYPLTLIIFFVLLYLFVGKLFNPYIYMTTIGVFLVGITLFVYFVGKYLNSWDYPRIVKIENGNMRYLKFNLGNKIYVDMCKPIDLNLIYRIVIKDRSFQIYYIQDGKKYLTSFILDSFFIRHVTKEVEKRIQILKEVLKRVDSNKVEIIDKRKRKKFKIEGGDR